MSYRRAVAWSGLNGGTPTDDGDVVIDQAIATKENEFWNSAFDSFCRIQTNEANSGEMAGIA
jgi:hypothetical protein